MPLRIRLNNNGQWYVAKSIRTVREIERMFLAGKVGGALYMRVGGLVQGCKCCVYIQIMHAKDVIVRRGDDYVWEQRYIDEPEWAVGVCLRELGVRLLNKVTEREVKEMYLRVQGERCRKRAEEMRVCGQDLKTGAPPMA